MSKNSDPIMQPAGDVMGPTVNTSLDPGWGGGIKQLGVIGLAVLAGFLILSRYNYLLFHALVEMFSIAVAWSVFLLVWNTRRIVKNDALIFLGIAYLFVGIVDLMHILAYKGMGIFSDSDAANQAIQLWMSARSLESLGLLIFPILLGRRTRLASYFWGYAVVTGLMLAAIFAWHKFPVCYVDGVGLTVFKKWTEYAICITLLGSIVLLMRKREFLDVTVCRLMIAAIVFTILAELAFTFYVNVYGFSNLIGHFFKLISYFLIYISLIHSGLTRPYTILFRDLKKNERELLEKKNILDQAQEVAGIGSFVWDLKNNGLRLSESMFAITGTDKSSFTGIFTETVKNMVHPDDQAELFSEVDQMIVQKRTWPVRFRFLRPGGSVRHVESSTEFLMDDNDEPATCIGVLYDITDRQESEQEREITIRLLRLMNSQNNLHELMQSTVELLHDWSGCDAIGIRLKDGDDYPYFETRGFPEEFVLMENQLCQYTPDGDVVCDPSGNPVLECMCGNILCSRFNPDLPFFTEGGSFWTNSTSDLLASTSEADRQARTRNRCNGEGYESVALIPLRTADETFGLLQFNDTRRNQFSERKIHLLERLAGSLSIALAQRKEARHLRQNRQELRGLLDATLESMALIEPDGRLLECNATFASRLGHAREDILGNNVFEQLPSDVAKSRRRLVQQVLEIAKPIQFEDQRNGIVFAHSLYPVMNDQGQVRALAIFALDVTLRKQAEQALKESELRYRTVADFTYDWEMWIAPDGHILYCSHSVFQITGYHVEEILDDPTLLETMIHPDDRQTVSEHFRKERIDDPHIFNLDYRLITKDGRERWVSHCCTPVYDEQKHFLGRRGSVRDITERKQIQIRLQQTLEATTDGIWYWHFPSNSLTFSPCYYTMLGYEPGEFPATYDKWAELIHPDDRAPALAVAEDYLRTEHELYENEFRLRTKSGDYRWIHAKAKIVDRSADGAPVLMIGNHEDITDRKAAETSLKDIRNRLAIAVDSAGIGVWELDVASEILTWDDWMYIIYGIEPGRSQCTLETWKQRVHPDDRADAYHRFELAISGQKEFDAEFRIVRPDGDIRHVKAYAKVLRDADGTPVKTIGVNYDITRRKQTELELNRKHQELKAIYDHSPVMMCVLDQQCRVIYANKELADFMGLTEEGLLHQRACGVFGCVNALDDPRGCGFGPKCEFCEIRLAMDDTLKTGKSHRTVEYNAELISTRGKREISLLGSTTLVPSANGRHLLLCLLDITERKQAEQNLQRHTTVLSSVREAQGLLIERRDKSEVFRSLLNTLVQLTDSEYGFIDEVLTDENGQLYKRSLAISDISWDENSRMLYEQLKSNDMKFTNLVNLAGLPAVTDHLVISNDVKHDTRSRGLPAGHPSIRAFMGIPMHIGDQVVGVAGIANRKDGYNEQIAQFLEPFIATCAGIIDAFRHIDRENEYKQKLMNLVSKLIRAEEQERKRIADLLHDSVGQSIAFAKVKVDVLAQSTPSDDQAHTLGEISHSLKEIIGQTRDLSFELSCPTLTTLGLAAAIQEFAAEELENKRGIEVRFKDDQQPKPLNENIQSLLYRATRELIINIIKHAKARHADITIQCVDHCVEIHVNDDGIGFEAYRIPKTTGFGLLSIRERLTFAGGQLAIHSTPNRGTQITLRAPLEKSESDRR